MDYKTSNFTLATYLMCMGARLKGVERVDRNRKSFVFDEKPEEGSRAAGMGLLSTEAIANEYLWGGIREEKSTLRVNVKEYEECRIRLLDRLNES